MVTGAIDCGLIQKLVIFGDNREGLGTESSRRDRVYPVLNYSLSATLPAIKVFYIHINNGIKNAQKKRTWIDSMSAFYASNYITCIRSRG